MRNRQPGRWIVVAAGLMVAAHASQARACGYEEVIVPALAIGFLAPSDVGVALPAADPSSPRFVLGWSWQIPIGGSANLTRHRLVPGADLLLGHDSASWRGRLGYRYGRRHVFAGAGVGLDGAGPNLSPELGVKFGHGNTGDRDFDPSLHLVARTEIAPESGRVRGATILLGWNMF
jgi:hypothetical protein